MNIAIRNVFGIDRPLKVGIVDDSKLIRDKIREYLAVLPAVSVVGEAEDVHGGIRMITNQNPDVVFLDIRLKDENGMSILFFMKKELPAIQVIMFSNSADSFYRRKFTESGCDYFLDKSMDFDRIPGIIDGILNS
jgi:DNA-binding NarL/FixJ family response regulator